MALRPIPDDASWYAHGESVSMEERVVVAPSWGRLHGLRKPGNPVRRGAPIARLVEAGRETPLVASHQGTLMGWLVLDGERVRPGTALARIRVPQPRRQGRW